MDARSGGCPPASVAARSSGFGFDRDHLADAGIDEAGAFASVTNGDNSNILCARIARETYRIERVVARIYDPRRALIYQRLGIHTVATVQWTTDQVLRRLLPDETRHDWVDATGKVGLVERPIPPVAVGHKWARSTSRAAFGSRPCPGSGRPRSSRATWSAKRATCSRSCSAMDALDELQTHLAEGGDH